MRNFRQFFLLAFLVLILFFTSLAYAYNPPLGIPAPAFGIDETAPVWPSGWPGSSVAGYYYVDNTHPSATDSGNTYGYPNKPRLTFPGSSFAAGSYIEIHGGPYASNITMSCSGTMSAPCWVRGTATSMPTLTGSISLSGSYLILEYVDFNGGTDGCISVGGTATSYISIRNSKCHNRAYAGNTSGVGINPSPGGSVHDVVVYKNTFEELGDWQTTIDQDFHGVNPDLWGRDSTASEYNVWILENTFRHLSGNGVQVNAGNWTDSYKYLHHIYIGRNTGYENRQAAFWSKQASHVIMSQNVAYSGRQHGDQPGDGVGFQYGPDNLWIIFNDIYDSNFGIRQSSTPSMPNNKAYIVGNVVHNIHPEPGVSYNPTDAWRYGQAVSLWEGNMQRFVVDNTIYDVHGGINAIQSGPLTISGNIISNINPQDYHVATWNAVGVTNVDRSLFHQASGAGRFGWGWGTVYTSLSAFKNATGECANCLEGDPLFLDTATNDFRLRTNSPAIDANIRHQVYTTFYNLYGIDIAKDFAGTARPQGANFDIGAYEVVDTAAPYVVIERCDATACDNTYSINAASISIGGTAGIGSTTLSGTTIASITWSNDKGGSGNCTGTTSWACNNISLQSGQNTITITVADSNGKTGIDVVVVNQNTSGGGGDTGGNTGNSGGGDTSSGGGSGCGFVKDIKGKGQEAKGEGLSFAMMLVIILGGIALAKRAKRLIKA